MHCNNKTKLRPDKQLYIPPARRKKLNNVEPYEEEISEMVVEASFINKTPENNTESNDEKVFQRLGHVIEVYDFPSTFKTQDIMTIYNDIDPGAIHIKWCDYTHVLLIFGTLVHAERALAIRHDWVSSRPLLQASQVARECALIAQRHDALQPPAKPRPPTSASTARRMIAAALNTKSNHFRPVREIREHENELLRVAKETRRQRLQDEIAAWEGNPRPSSA